MISLSDRGYLPRYSVPILGAVLGSTVAILVNLVYELLQSKQLQQSPLLNKRS